jgi:hypothetical protein
LSLERYPYNTRAEKAVPAFDKTSALTRLLRRAIDKAFLALVATRLREMPATAKVADLIDAVHEAGGTIRCDGDKLELTAPRPLPSDLVARIREAKPVLFAVFDWQARQREAVTWWSYLHPPGEAAELAWGEMLSRWHTLHGRHCAAWQRAGCEAPIGDLPALDLADGNRVHLTDSLSCLFSFGERWRDEAARGLRALGINP